MTALLWRELTIATRTTAFAAAVGLHSLILVLFIVLWGDGVPLLPGDGLYGQLRLVQYALLTCLLPWTAARCGSGSRGEDVALLSTIAATRSSSIVAAQGVALMMLLLVVVAAGIPLMVIGQQMAAVSSDRVAADTLGGVGLAALVAFVTLAWMQTSDDRVVAWLGASATTILVVLTATASMPRAAVAVCLFVTGVAGIAGCAARAREIMPHPSPRRV